MPPESPSLHQVRGKIRWAEVHLERLDAVLSNYLNNEPYGVAPGPTIEDWSTKEPIATVLVRDVKPLPSSLPLVVGDFLYNLRASLDYLAWQLVLLSGGVPNRGTSFPVLLKPKENGVANLIMPTVRQQLVALVDSVQPYQEGAQAKQNRLHVLHTLNNVDKHRHLHLLALTTAGARTELRTASGRVLNLDYQSIGIMGEDRKVHYIPLKDGTAIGAFPVRDAHNLDSSHVQVRAFPNLVVTLDEPDSVIEDGVAGVSDTLRTLLDEVRLNVVPLFEPFFPSDVG